MLVQKKRSVVVVDAYSGGKHLVSSYQSLGYPVIHVRSGDYSYYAEDCKRAEALADVAVRYDGDVKSLVEVIRPHQPILVMAGSEGGVLLADELSSQLDLSFRNPSELSVARRDKFLMQERIKSGGLRGIEQVVVGSVSEFDAWNSARGPQFPVVVKPLRSAATDSVYVCQSREAVCEALDAIIDNVDMFNSKNEAALCQEFLQGDEVVVNGVCCDGVKVFTEGWRSDKVGFSGSRVYDIQYLIFSGDEDFDIAASYVRDVCDVLGIRNGAFHAEVMLTESGPVLIEIAARLAGGADPYVIERCIGPSQLNVLVQTSLHRELRDAYTQNRSLGARAAYVYLIAKRSGVVSDVDLTPFLDIEGVVSASYRYGRGDTQLVTRDLMTAAGVVLVVSPDEESLARSISLVRRAEESFYSQVLIPV